MANSQPDKPTAIEFLAKFDTTVLAGLVFLGLGGAIISFYYSHIRYLPDIEWSQSIVHLATATLIGGGFATLFGLSLFLPGCMWSAFLLRDEKLTDAFWFRETDEDEVCLRTLLCNIGLPFGVVVFANHLVLLGSEKSFESSLLYVYGFIGAILLIPMGFWIKHNLEGLLKDKEKDLGKDKGRRFFKYIAWFLVSIVVSQFSMLLIYLFSGRPTGSAFWITTVFCVLGVLISNHFVAIHYEKNRVQSVLVSLVIAGLLLFIADRNSTLSLQVLAFFGLGEKSASVDLLLTKEGADASETLGLHERCMPKLKERLCDVQVLSRLGNEYLLKADDHTFTLPKSAVISRISRPPAPDEKK
jgi:putative Mn2+ efflux pump MntP